MKKNLLITLVLVFVATAFVFAFSPERDLKPSEYNIGISYDSAMKEKKPFIMMFYSDYCSSCIKFASKYRLIEEIYKNKYNVVMLNVDDPKNEGILNEFWPAGIPNVFVVGPSIDNRIHINSAIYGDLSRLRNEFDRYLRIRAMIKK